MTIRVGTFKWKKFAWLENGCFGIWLSAPENRRYHYDAKRCIKDAMRNKQ